MIISRRPLADYDGDSLRLPLPTLRHRKILEAALELHHGLTFTEAAAGGGSTAQGALHNALRGASCNDPTRSLSDFLRDVVDAETSLAGYAKTGSVSSALANIENRSKTLTFLLPVDCESAFFSGSAYCRRR